MLDNYRPISILPVVSKLIEWILYNQLSNYLKKESILSEYQFGFRSCHSTTTLIDCSNEWYVNMDRGQYNLVVFLDIKKAFDTVNHDILLKKLEMYGLGDSALALLRNYLTDRTQICQLQGMLSEQRTITCGIPQGSILGPLPFTLYINDLPNCLKHTTPRMFADDTSLTAAGETLGEVERRVNEDYIYSILFKRHVSLTQHIWLIYRRDVLTCKNTLNTKFRNLPPSYIPPPPISQTN